MEICELLDLHKLDKFRFLHDTPNKEPKKCFCYQAAGKRVLETQHFQTKTCVNGDRLTWPRLRTEGDEECAAIVVTITRHPFTLSLACLAVSEDIETEY